MSDALDDFLDPIIAALQEAVANSQPYAKGTVQTVTPTVTVDVNGTIYAPKVPVGYSLEVGQTVLIARFGPQRLILHAY